MKLRNIALFGLATLLAVGLAGCVSQSCIEKSGAVPVTDPEIIEQLPVRYAVDGEGDLNLFNPLDTFFDDDVRELFGLEDLGHLYRDYDLALVPEVFDVRAINISGIGEKWRFVVDMSGVGDKENRFQPAVSSGQGRVAIYLDTDIDSISDVILTTIVTEDGTVRMVAVDSEYHRLASGAEIEVQWDEGIHQLTIDIPATLVGQHYDWVLVTGFAVSAEASCAAVSDELVRWVPTVDIVIPDCPYCPAGEEGSICFYDFFQITSCQIFKSKVGKDCPMAGQKPGPLPGKTGQQGWLSVGVECGQQKMGFYCSGDWVAWVENGVSEGWFGHCPYGGGQNSIAAIDTDGNKIPEGWKHLVHTKEGVVPYRQVEYIYHFGPPYTYWIFLTKGTKVNKCMNLLLTDDPWGLPGSHCSYPTPCSHPKIILVI